MTYAQFPYAVLTKLGSSLDSLKTDLSSKNRGADDCDGLGSEHQSRIQDAIGDFRGTWKTSVSDLIDEVGEWGTKSAGIGTMVQQFDDQSAAMLRPPGGAGPAQ